MATKKMNKVTHIEIRMYRMGTGDCFALKFYSNENVRLKMLIDAGCWSGNQERIKPYIESLKEYFEGHVNVLVVTHEHKDHVHAFDVCKELFTKDFFVDDIWMGWTENDSVTKIKDWKKKYGEKKKALSLASLRVNTAFQSPTYRAHNSGNNFTDELFAANQHFSDALTGFADLHSLSIAGVYLGGLAGMEVVKKKIPFGNISYLKPGEIIEDLSENLGIKFYILGPPLLYENIKKESGGEGESYDHNKDILNDDLFAAAILNADNVQTSDLQTFNNKYLNIDQDSLSYNLYNNDLEAWRRIDEEWLMSSGSLALRMNSLTNNLSVAFAIEFEESKKVLLFPGDAEYGSWKSWHDINWNQTGVDPNKHLTEDLLNRVVFYKVAHHLSHNGTAKRLGLDMMVDRDLVAMATLDYSVISNQWKGTMPNKAIVKELIEKTKGRLIIMQTEGLYSDKDETISLSDRIIQEQNRMTRIEQSNFKNNLIEDNLYYQFVVNGVG